MRRKLIIAALLMFGCYCISGPFNIAAAADEQILGTWKGEWEGGGGSGRFDLTFVHGSDGKLSAMASVGTEGGDYNAKFTTVALNADKLTGAYDYPPDVQAEVTVTGTFDPKTATGTWSLAAKGQPGGQSIAGTWKVSKQ
jgi:hypothetical protein